MNKNDNAFADNNVLSDYRRKKSQIIKSMLNRHRYQELLPNIIDHIPDEDELAEILEESVETYVGKEGK